MAPNRAQQAAQRVARLGGAQRPVGDGDRCRRSPRRRRGRARRWRGPARCCSRADVQRARLDPPGVGRRRARRSRRRARSISTVMSMCAPDGSRPPLVAHLEPRRRSAGAASSRALTNCDDSEASRVTLPPSSQPRPCTVSGSRSVVGRRRRRRGRAAPSTIGASGRSCDARVAVEADVAVGQRGHRRQEAHHGPGVADVDVGGPGQRCRRRPASRRPSRRSVPIAAQPGGHQRGVPAAQRGDAGCSGSEPARRAPAPGWSATSSRAAAPWRAPGRRAHGAGHGSIMAASVVARGRRGDPCGPSAGQVRPGGRGRPAGPRAARPAGSAGCWSAACCARAGPARPDRAGPRCRRRPASARRASTVLEEVDPLLGPLRPGPPPPRTGARPGRRHQAAGEQRRATAAGTGPSASISPAPTWTAPLILHQLLGVLGQVRQLRRDRRRHLVGGGHLAAPGLRRASRPPVTNMAASRGGRGGVRGSWPRPCPRPAATKPGTRRRALAGWTDVCGRYAASRSPDDLVEEFEVGRAPGAGLPAELQRRARPRTSTPWSSGRRGASRRRRRDAGCGSCAGGWCRPGRRTRRSATGMINARMETVAEKPAFRQGVREAARLLPADGYFEWYGEEKGKKQPFFIRPADGGVLAMAGLYELWRDPRCPRTTTPTLAVDRDRAHHHGHRRPRPHPRPDAAARRDASGTPSGSTRRSTTPTACGRCWCRPRPAGSRRTRCPRT